MHRSFRLLDGRLESKILIRLTQLTPVPNGNFDEVNGWCWIGKYCFGDVWLAQY